MKAKRALLIVDVQNDFCPGGALGIVGGDRIIPMINRYIRIFAKKGWPVLATRDWHPIRTRHFKSFGGAWPVHCIQNTTGAQFHPRLKLPKDAVLLYKGMDPEKDSYSTFQAEDLHGMGLLNLLKVLGAKEIYIAGLATDYCVKYSAIDALKHGFKVRVLVDAIQGVNLKPRDSEEALKRIIKMGAKKLRFPDFKI